MINGLRITILYGFTTNTINKYLSFYTYKYITILNVIRCIMINDLRITILYGFTTNSISRYLYILIYYYYFFTTFRGIVHDFGVPIPRFLYADAGLTRLTSALNVSTSPFIKPVLKSAGLPFTRPVSI
jgi:hypothetical protein